MGNVVSASDDFLLDIQSKMRSHLHQLESQEHKYKETEVRRISLDDKLVTDLKSLICKLGEVGVQIEASGMSGPEYASVMRVGDRVRRGRDWQSGNQDGNPPGCGTIIRIVDNGIVFVNWDCGGIHEYWMGYGNIYELQRA